MAEVKISDLPDGGDIALGDIVPVVRSGMTMKANRSPVVASISQAGSNIQIDNSDPENIVVRVLRTVMMMFNENGTLAAGEAAKLGNCRCDNTEGWIVPFDGTLTLITISRGDSDAAEIDVHVNGANVLTVSTNAAKNVEAVSLPVLQGDAIRVYGGAASPNNLSQVVVEIMLEES